MNRTLSRMEGLGFDIKRLARMKRGQRIGGDLAVSYTAATRRRQPPGSEGPVRAFVDRHSVLVIGQLDYGTTSRSRFAAFEGMFATASEVNVSPFIEQDGWRTVVTNHFYGGALINEINASIVSVAERHNPELVWIDKGLHVWPETLHWLRRRGAALVHFSPDNQMVLGNQSRHYAESIPIYDAHITTKLHNVDWLKKCGARRVEWMGKGFDPEIHRPEVLGDEDRRQFQCDVGFVGHWEPDRERVLLRLHDMGYRVKVWGGNWSRANEASHPLFAAAKLVSGENYAKAICGARINLCLLSAWFEDRSTARSVEIPACGAFMLADRTTEHLELYKEGEEAEFYGSDDELIRKIDYYLTHEEDRARIAEGGRRRCLAAYSNRARIDEILRRLAGG